MILINIFPLKSAAFLASHWTDGTLLDHVGVFVTNRWQIWLRIGAPTRTQLTQKRVYLFQILIYRLWAESTACGIGLLPNCVRTHEGDCYWIPNPAIDSFSYVLPLVAKVSFPYLVLEWYNSKGDIGNTLAKRRLHPWIDLNKGDKSPVNSNLPLFSKD